MTRKPDYWPLMQAGRFQDVIEALLLEAPTWAPGDHTRPIALAGAYMAVRNYEQALKYYKLAQEFSNTIGITGSCDCDVGAAHWLVGNRDLAVQQWQDHVQAIMAGKHMYSDISRGCEACLLLFYGLATTRNKELAKFVTKALKWAITGRGRGSMPGPLMPFLLGKTPLSEVLEKAMDVPDVASGLAKAKHDVLTRREMSQVLLAAASYERMNENEAAAEDYFRMSRDLGNTMIQDEWYLLAEEAMRLS